MNQPSGAWVLEAMLMPEHYSEVSTSCQNTFRNWIRASPDSDFDTLESAMDKMLNGNWNSIYYFRIKNRETGEVIPKEIFVDAHE